MWNYTRKLFLTTIVGAPQAQAWFKDPFGPLQKTYAHMSIAEFKRAIETEKEDLRKMAEEKRYRGASQRSAQAGVPAQFGDGGWGSRDAGWRNGGGSGMGSKVPHEQRRFAWRASPDIDRD